MKKNILILIFVLVVIAIILFLAFKFNLWKPKTENKKLEIPLKTINNQNKQVNLNRSFNWKNNEKYLLEEINKEFPGISLADLKLSEESIADINNDSIPEILIDLGIGGAAINNYIFITFKDNLPSLLKFKTKEGDIRSLIFDEGTGGAGRYGSSIGISEKDSAIYQFMFYAYNSNDDFCSVDAYKFNNKTNLYEYDKNLSEQFKNNECQNLCKTLEDEELKFYFQRICLNYWR